MNGYRTGLQSGFMSPNDVRDLEGLDRIPSEEGGNTYIVDHKLDAMIACKEMVEAIIQEPVNLGLDGKVTTGF